MKLQKRLDKIDIEIPSIGGSIGRFYLKIKEINNSIDFSKIDICSKSKFIKSRQQHSLLDILKYAYYNNLLLQSLQMYSLKEQQKFVELVKNDRTEDLKCWMSSNGRYIMRDLNGIAYSNNIPSNLFNKYLDIDVLNEFVDMEILDSLLKQSNYKNTFKIRYKNLIINLDIIGEAKIVPLPILNKLVNIIIILGQYKSKTRSITINIDIYLTDFKKKLNIRTKSLGSREINSGFTASGHKLCIFRKEELYKVLTHELIHYLKLDLVRHVEFTDYYKYFNIPQNTEIRLNEAYTEIFAVIFNSMINTKSEKELVSVLNRELKYSLYQCAKILDYYNFGSALEFFKRNDGNTKFNQQTSVFSYFIVKTLILFNLDVFLEFYEKIDHTNFKDFVIGLVSLKFIETLEAFMKLIRKQDKNSDMYNSLTMVYFNDV